MTNAEYILEFIDSTESECKIPIIIGYDGENNLLVDNLSRTPHILVGGATGSGKSIFLQNIIASLVTKFTADEIKLVLFDLKRVEFEYAKELPHLEGEVVNNIDDAVRTLQGLVNIMNDRRRAMNDLGIVGSLSRRGTNCLEKYNAFAGKQLPYIVVVIDEYAELVMQSDIVKELIYDLALHGHGAGIHLILASQRASDEIFPSDLRAIVSTRAVCRVASQEDSWTMLTHLGAEKLPHTFGEMLYSSIWLGAGKPIKIKVPYISEKKSIELARKD